MIALGLAAGVGGLTLSWNDTAKAEGVYMQTPGTHVVIRHRRGYEAMASADTCPAGGWLYRPHIGRGPWLCDPTPSVGTCLPGTTMIEGLCRAGVRSY
jgi:hypothetical protein